MSGWEGLSRALRDRKFAGLLLLLALGIGLVALSFFLPGQEERARSADADLARKGREFQEEMDAIAAAYEGFAKRWNNARSLELDERGFRDDANTVLRRVHERMQRENRDLYPRIEAM